MFCNTNHNKLICLALFLTFAMCFIIWLMFWVLQCLQWLHGGLFTLNSWPLKAWPATVTSWISDITNIHLMLCIYMIVSGILFSKYYSHISHYISIQVLSHQDYLFLLPMKYSKFYTLYLLTDKHCSEYKALII